MQRLQSLVQAVCGVASTVVIQHDRLMAWLQTPREEVVTHGFARTWVSVWPIFVNVVAQVQPERTLCDVVNSLPAFERELNDPGVSTT